MSSTGGKWYGKLIVSTNFRNFGGPGAAWDARAYEESARRAKDAGATHLVISQLGERTDYRGEDKGSPWCEWSIHTPSIFKFVLPKGLEDAFPREFVARQMSLLKRRHDVAAKVGLKCAFWANEPHWLSERVYAKHPQWRGARCDNSLRTTGLFFAPCVDNPEVLELYREAVREMVRQCPALDTFTLMTNDSGSGLCWSKQLYVNPNGNSDCIYRPMGERVTGFFRAIREGARSAGGDADVRLHWVWLPPDEARDVASCLRDDEKLSFAGLAGWGDNEQVRGLGNPCAVVARLASARKSGGDFLVTAEDRRWFDLFELFNASANSGGELAKAELLTKFAAARYGAAAAEETVSAWYDYDRALLLAGSPGAQVPVLTIVGTVGHRWLARPLVAHPELLTPEEEAYWLPYIYQSEESQPEVYRNYVARCGSPDIDWRAASTISCCIDTVSDLCGEAAAKLESAAAKAKDAAAKAELLLEARRLRVFRCAVLCIRHTVQVGALIYERDKVVRVGSTDPEIPDNPRGSEGLYYLHRALRWELDNMNDLIRLLKESPEPIFRCTADKSQEGAFLYGPDLVENLERKVAIMLRHWRDAEKGFYRPTLGG